jgi:hypothetical protein
MRSVGWLLIVYSASLFEPSHDLLESLRHVSLANRRGVSEHWLGYCV